MRIVLFLFTLLFALTATAEERKLQVVVSFSILEDMVKQLGGDYVEVHSLIQRGQDAHGFEPKPADAKLIKNADLIIVNGLGFDDWMEKLAATSGYTGNIAIATKTLAPLMHKHGEENIPDPHAWQSPNNAHIYARNITTALAATDTQHADYYGERLSGYLLRIKEIKGWTYGILSSVPPAARVIAVPHNTFAYFARDYRFTIYSPQGLNSAEEVSASDVATIIDEIRAKKTSAIFTENTAQVNLMQQIAEDTGVKEGGVLYTDALSEEDGEAGTYLEMLHTNISRIASVLPKK